MDGAGDSHGTAWLDVLRGCADRLGGTRRPGQERLAADVAAVISGDGRLVGEAPTGSGKALAQICPAAAAAQTGTRTAVSTATLALQTQIIDRDAPLVADVCRSLGLRPPVTAIHKGYGNYICLMAVCVVAGADPAATTDPLREARALLEAAPKAHGARAALWGLAQHGDGGDGDKARLPPDVPAADWAAVSVSSADCVGTGCPFADECFPRQARQAAGEADIVVTNHALCAIQAATGAPVVTGNTVVGDIRVLMVDECHALPDTIRRQGAVVMSGREMRRAATALERAYARPGGADGGVADLAGQGRRLADVVDQETAALRRGAVGDDQVLFPVAAGLVGGWCAKVARAARMSAAKQPAGSRVLLPMRRLEARADALRDAMRTVSRPGDVARWVEPGADGDVVRASPVDVGGLLDRNLWRDPRTGETRPVVCVSATVPAGFGGQAGLGTGTRAYESTFTATYKDSTCVYVPSGGGSWRGADGKLDVAAHARWCVPQILSLVTANRGAALILAATTANGAEYARALRAAWDGPVLSQWDDRPVEATVELWRSDPGAALVGTRTLMTGVDAPGDTCTLVVVDRVPRAAPNPVDDARVRAVQSRSGMDRWAADRLVYYGDAKLLLQQAVGRLIRRDTDRGLVAVLDPRLAPGPGAYSPPVRGFLTAVFAPYGTTVRELPDAIRWVEARRGGAPRDV